MSSEEAKRTVTAGLQQRREARQLAEQEAQLEQYEQEQIQFCNEHCADAKFQRRMEETGRLNQEQMEARRAARAEALAKELAREEAATTAVKRYGISCMAILCLTIFTNLPLWAAVTLALGLGVFPAAYIFRLYYPLRGEDNA